MTPSCAERIASVVSGCHSRLACSSKRACMFFNAVSRAVPSDVLGRIIIIMPPQRMPTITSHTRAWAISHNCVISTILTIGNAMIAAV
ncbi:Uncharacterised protein [Salmonella enterica subsp. enterica serovar Bovismorbificans]|uniref:Uncharacterized protein n=1 Tax=Salmonella enterica subsp. enterica serovar Bovismorbificans TaxID=58097 RepID=A0A655BL26_SALET|nr:Uncharacterised protein [Salmonella enterica subsp. enterica serovar Bovismorbificans]CNU12246.1 Uncharacterised protein [Salmonella enterica subsp. enterica serovar Bovismorbificans]CNU42722.1 Uncharacterised protein [Salmonella enterica subsp. enterica serovar Bovismorbificans]VFS83178.1 Uncharacterised protein [Salmonella enterica subsp. enterica]